MQVWRIEHASVRHDPEVNGRGAAHFIGPFRTCEALDFEAGANIYIRAAGIDWYHFNSMPCPHEDGLSFEAGMLCGCTSLAQLREWFHHEEGLHALAASGFVARAYDVPEIAVQVGRMQCVFAVELCRNGHVAELSPTELLTYAEAA